MIASLPKVNKYGGCTIEIQDIHPLFPIVVHGTSAGSYIVEFKELRFFGPKIHLTFCSNDTIEITIEDAFERIFLFLQESGKYQWSKRQKTITYLSVISELHQIDNKYLP